MNLFYIFMGSGSHLSSPVALIFEIFILTTLIPFSTTYISLYSPILSTNHPLPSLQKLPFKKKFVCNLNYSKEIV